MRRFLSFLFVALACWSVQGCASSQVGKSDIDRAFPKQSKEEVESELKKHPKEYQDYLNAQKRDEEYRRQGGSDR